MNLNDFQRVEDEFSQNNSTFEDDNTFQSEKIYIPRRQHNFLKISTYVIGSFVLIFVASFIFAAYVSKKEFISEDLKKTDEENLNLLYSLVMLVDKSIWTFDVDNEEFTLLKKTKNQIIALETYLDKTIFWSENNIPIVNSLWKSHPNISHHKNWKPQSIAFDYVTEKIYLIDKLSGTLNIVDKNSKFYTVLISDLINPHDLVLDPVEGLVFIVQQNQSIIRANMDGTSVTKVIDSPGISAIALDTKEMKVYWANDKESIEISDYDGNRRFKLIDKVDMGVNSMTVFDKTLYWTSSSSFKNTFPFSRILWSCTLNKTACGNMTFYKLPFNNPTLIKSSFNQYQHHLINPCKKNNNGCQNLCLMTSRGNHDCACNIGWKLNSDGKTCDNNISTIVYIQDDFVRGKMLSEKKELLVDTIIPTKIFMNNLKKKSVIYFDYDVISGKFYFSDDHSLYEIDLLQGGEQKNILNVNQNYVIGRIAYDWMSNNIYFVQQSQSSRNNHSVEEFNVKSKDLHASVLSYKSSKDSLIINCPLSLMVHPTKKYLFYILYDSTYDYIQRVTIDNDTIKPLVLSNSSKTYYELITLNVLKSELYYIQHDDLQTIKITNLDGLDQKNIKIQKSISSVKFVGCQSNYFYVGNFTGIWRINRETGENEGEITRPKSDNGKIHSMRIYNFADRLVV